MSEAEFRRRAVFLLRRMAMSDEVAQWWRVGEAVRVWWRRAAAEQ